MEAIIHGITLSISLMLPIGVQNVFVFNVGVFQRSLLKTLLVVAVVSLCDTFLICIAVAGVSVSIFKNEAITTFAIALGALFLFYVGWLIWNENGDNVKSTAFGKTNYRQHIFLAISLSILNPHALLDTLGFIGLNSLKYEGIDKTYFTVSSITVSWCWFILVSFLGRYIGRKDTSGNLIILLNKVSAIIMWFIGIYLLFEMPIWP